MTKSQFLAQLEPGDHVFWSKGTSGYSGPCRGTLVKVVGKQAVVDTEDRRVNLPVRLLQTH